jgi:hypothetical protein
LRLPPAGHAQVEQFRTLHCIRLRTSGVGIDQGIRVLVYADHPIIARAAFRGAVEAYPKARIRLRNRALVMQEHRPKE